MTRRINFFRHALCLDLTAKVLLEVCMELLGVGLVERLREELDGLIRFGELLMEESVFFLKILNQAHFGVVVLDRLVRDVRGLGGILEGVDVLLYVEVARI